MPSHLLIYCHHSCHEQLQIPIQRPYLKIGGILITNNNHQNDAVDAARDDRLVFKALIRFNKGKYHLEEETRDKRKITAPKSSTRYLKQTSQGLVYIENETYHVFKRIR